MRKLRKERQLSQEVMAERIGISQKYLSELERGQKAPSWETLVAIAHKGFDIKLASLMFGIDEDVGAEAKHLNDVLAGRPKEARYDVLRAVELLLRSLPMRTRRRSVRSWAKCVVERGDAVVEPVDLDALSGAVPCLAGAWIVRTCTQRGGEVARWVLERPSEVLPPVGRQLSLDLRRALVEHSPVGAQPVGIRCL